MRNCRKSSSSTQKQIFIFKPIPIKQRRNLYCSLYSFLHRKQQLQNREILWRKRNRWLKNQIISVLLNLKLNINIFKMNTHKNISVLAVALLSFRFPSYFSIFTNLDTISLCLLISKLLQNIHSYVKSLIKCLFYSSINSGIPIHYKIINFNTYKIDW